MELFLIIFILISQMLCNIYLKKIPKEPILYVLISVTKAII